MASCRAAAVIAAIAVTAVVVVDVLRHRLAGAPYAPLRSYTSHRNPPWAAARWRGDEHRTPQFSQWYYCMISDAGTGNVFSIGFGGFAGDRLAGGWVRRKSAAAALAEYDATSWPEEWVPLDHLDVAGAGGLDLTIRRRADVGATAPPPMFSIATVNDTSLRYTAHLTSGAGGGAVVDLVFTRIYGVFNGDPDDERTCDVANLPFAYDSLVAGTITMDGGVVYNFAPGPSQRAYVESTWGCTFPQPGHGSGDEPIDYPVSRVDRGREVEFRLRSVALRVARHSVACSVGAAHRCAAQRRASRTASCAASGGTALRTQRWATHRRAAQHSVARHHAFPHPRCPFFAVEVDVGGISADAASSKCSFHRCRSPAPL